jgi:hypothetical protein
LKSESLSLLESSGPVQACKRIAFFCYVLLVDYYAESTAKRPITEKAQHKTTDNKLYLYSYCHRPENGHMSDRNMSLIAIK